MLEVIPNSQQLALAEARRSAHVERAPVADLAGIDAARLKAIQRCEARATTSELERANSAVRVLARGALTEFGIDHGARCEQHVGEVYPPRCAACDLAATERMEQL